MRSITSVMRAWNGRKRAEAGTWLPAGVVKKKGEGGALVGAALPQIVVQQQLRPGLHQSASASALRLRRLSHRRDGR